MEIKTVRMSRPTTTAASATAAGTPADDNRFEMKATTVNWNRSSLVEGELIHLDCLKPICTEHEEFFPETLYVRKEMCEVFGELTKSDRKQQQILIGSPGVGKSVLLFLVALYRVLSDGIPAIFVRKPKNAQELTSVFYMKKLDNSSIRFFYDRNVERRVTVYDAFSFILSKYENIHTKAVVPIRDDAFLLYIDGLHEGDAELGDPHHYLSTSGGHDAPQGEFARKASLVVLGGWSEASLEAGLEKLSINLLDSEIYPDLNDGGEKGESNQPGAEDAKMADGDDDGGEDAKKKSILNEIFYHTGGRIREVFDYVKNPIVWKREKKAMIGKIKKQDALLSIVETKGSGDKNSPDRVRTMFRNGDPDFFGDCLQIVDSQFYAQFLRDRCSLEDYYNAYVHAKKAGLSGAAGCHFEELLHRLFFKCPRPVAGFVQSVGKGSEGIDQMENDAYWVPSIPNFANIDSALLFVETKTLLCFQYTVSETHKFNPVTFRTKFLRPVLRKFGLKLEEVKVKIFFVVPNDVMVKFKIPEEVAENGWESCVEFVDCSGVDSLASLFERLDFIDSPVEYNNA